MTTLHTVNKSPFEQRTLRACMDVCQPGDAILLIEDGVYGALPASPDSKALQALRDRPVELFALEPDLRARGLLQRTSADISIVDYDHFVQLSVAHATLQSWY